MSLAPVLSVGVLWCGRNGRSGHARRHRPTRRCRAANATAAWSFRRRVPTPILPCWRSSERSPARTTSRRWCASTSISCAPGSASNWAVDGLIDIRFGDDYRFLDVGEQYLVGAGFDPEYAALSSNVRPPEPDFGGNDVVGVDDSAVECPPVDDPVRTLLVDGTDVDSGVMSLLFDDRRVLLATIAVPAAIAFAALVVLVLLRMFVGLATKGVFQLGRAAVTPVPDHRAVRVRRHRPEQ